MNIVQSMLKGIQKFWIVLLVLMLGGLSFYTSHPTYGAPAATPTPDVQTVPKPEVISTPTNTPFPTPTPEGDNSPSSGGGPVATRESDDNNDENEENNTASDNQGGGNSSNGNAPSSGGTTNTNNTGGSANTQAGANQANGARLTGVVAVVTLNMRKGPNTSEHIVDTLFMNDPVEVLGRDSSGGWWYICCGSRSQQSGWVNAQFITPDFAVTQANTLLSVVGGAGNQVAAPVSAATTNVAAGQPGTAPALLLEMRPLPAFAWQGQTLELHFVLHNNSNQPIANVQLRDDLPPELAFVKATVGSQGTASATATDQPGPIFTIHWPEVSANSQVTATVTVQIATAGNGALIDNLAVVKTAKGNEALAGITIAMPPTALPRFSTARSN